MSNILLLSTIYPLPSKENKGTAICHYFARDWLKMGHNVKVIHFQPVYLSIFHWVAKLNQKRIVAKTGAIVYTNKDKGISRYSMDEVDVTRIPLFKPLPHGRFRATSIKKAICTIISDNKSESFVPDIIVGHFPNPQIEVVGKLKEIYPSAKVCIVMHGESISVKKIYGSRLESLMSKIDVWGFRSKSAMNIFEAAICPVEKSFICYSGIPESYITDKNAHSFEGPLNTFIFVGEMIERKYPAQIIESLHKVYPEGRFKIKYIGDGQQLEKIRLKIDEYKLKEEVTILGRLPREEIKSQYDQAQCMIMISKSEAYGLVYLEAMARGCITIASRNEGFDGVIEDGLNGFLCNAGDVFELTNVIKRINALTSEERMKISECAIETAKELTDINTAKLYIENVISKA